MSNNDEPQNQRITVPTPDPTTATVESIAAAISSQRDYVNGRFEILTENLSSLDRLTEAKFVTYRTLVDSQADKVSLALDASEKAITKAEIATDKRFEAINGLRAVLAEQSAQMATRRELEAFIVELKATISELQKQTSELRSRLDVGPAGLSTLQNQYSTMQGRTQGSDITMGKIYGAVGAVGAVLGILFLLVNGISK